MGDGEGITQSVDVRFDIIWRRAAGGDTVLATTTHTFTPPQPANQFAAVMFETDLTGIAADAAAGDLLILRFATVGGATYTPNGDSTLAGARDPNLILP